MHNMVRLQTVLIVDWILNILKMKYKTISDITINKIKSEKFVIVFSVHTNNMNTSCTQMTLHVHNVYLITRRQTTIVLIMYNKVIQV